MTAPVSLADAEERAEILGTLRREATLLLVPAFNIAAAALEALAERP